MLKPTVKRGLFLDFIPNVLLSASSVDLRRIFALNDNKISDGDIYYVMTREFRLEDNWALAFARELANKYHRELRIVIFINNNYYSRHQESFLLKNLDILRKNLDLNGFIYEISEKFPQKAATIVTDFNPVNLHVRELYNLSFACFEVDSHNIIPARIVSDKQEFSAATLRRKIYGKIADFLTESDEKFNIIKGKSYEVLTDFVENKLYYYAQNKNNPTNDVTSNLSPYLHFGFISSQRCAIEVLKSNANRENKEVFLEELIVRKELADNFCLHTCAFKSLNAIPLWAKTSLKEHRNDIRAYLYTREEFELAKTHDLLWNKIQNQLLKTGKIHGYLRMYWAKKILEWTSSPEEALEIAVYLNDTYALDGMDPNGYVGILWSIGGVHDRAFTNRFVTGKIRNMGLAACKRNFDLKTFLKED